jgi:hypothetical protein
MVDTGVLRSGLQSFGGASRLLLCGIAERAFAPLVTVATLLEAEDVMMRPVSLRETAALALPFPCEAQFPDAAQSRHNVSGQRLACECIYHLISLVAR